MRIAHTAGAKGFFFLNATGLSTNTDRGMARLLAKAQTFTPATIRETHLCMDIRQQSYALPYAAII
ncbi:MAG: hypothetical protein ACE5DZ_09625 [Mariprofundus sp.]